MKKIVLDTNVIISAALSSKGNPAKIISHIANNTDAQFYYSSEILAEYEKVLAYEKINLSVDVQDNIIKSIHSLGILVEPKKRTKIHMPDESDRMFYDLAKEINAIIITGNTKHYPIEPHIMTPADFVEKMINT